MSAELRPFKQRLETALASETLPVALGRALPSFREKRAAALADQDFEALRADVTARKRAALDRLPELLERFTREAEAVGARVYRAATAADACRITGEIAAAHGAKLVVKGKSMATEEIGLNAYLEAQGLRVVETDLGEWIIQLAHETPSHMLAPAIHKTREEIAALFLRETGVSAPPEVTALVKVARGQLRQAFIDADIGITGANAAIADTGTLVIVSNEGNQRLVSTLPPVHIAIVGIDKLVASMDDATAMLKILARSATGQKQSSYVSFITGPSRSADIELNLAIGVHGPIEVHIIFLDNGREAMRADPAFREALQCIRCAACANICPPYQAVGGHAFGHIYTGPIGLVLTAFHHGLDAAAGPQSLCAQCNACETVCPAGIPLARMIADVRRRVNQKRGMPWLKRTAIRAVSTPGRFDFAERLLSVAQLPLTRGGRYVRKAPVLSRATAWRSLPAVAPRAFHATAPAETRPAPRVESGAAGLTLAYFPACLTDRLYPEMGAATLAVLSALGARVIVPRSLSCCGLTAANAGDEATALGMIKQTIVAMEAIAADYIVSTSASCTVAVLQDYPHLLRHEPDWAARAAALAPRVIDFTTFLDRVARLAPGALAGPAAAVTYHDACQSANCLGLGPEARRLLTEVMGFELREMAESSVCCGFGGSFSMEHPRVARRVLDRKLATITATNAPTVVADNPGCIMHLRGAMDARGDPTRVVHLVELMTERLLIAQQP